MVMYKGESKDFKFSFCIPMCIVRDAIKKSVIIKVVEAKILLYFCITIFHSCHCFCNFIRLLQDFLIILV